MSLDREQFRKPARVSAWAVRIGDEWFGGFGGKPGQEHTTKVRTLLADALLLPSRETANDYVRRLDKRGFVGVPVKVEVVA